MNKVKIIITAFSLLFCSVVSAQTIVGKWKTIDDNSGEPRSIVEIYKKSDKYFGKILKIYPKPGEPENPICDQCPKDKKGMRVIGMEIITGLKKSTSSEEYSGGEVLDPESGNVYDCKAWVTEEGTLKLRGYVYFIYRTQTWLPFND